MTKKIAFQTLGCKLNYAETSTYERGFIREGLEVVPWTDQADVYLINTCTVTEHSEKKARNIIRKMHRVSPDAKIIVTGCYAELRREEIEKIEGVAMVVGAKEKPALVEKTMKLLSSEEASHTTVLPLAEQQEEKPDTKHLDKKEEALAIQALKSQMAEEYNEISKNMLPAYSSGERTRSFLKVQDGCNNFCAYCTIPYARGRSRNLPICELVKQAEAIASEGIKEIVITGINTGDFGRSTGETFLDLLKALDQVEGIERYRISSIEPNLITQEIVDWIASGTKFLPHFHIPLQVGNDELLKKAGRKYDTALFADRIDYIRSVMDKEGQPKVFFGIDVIVGLPGETDKLFLDTYHFLENRIKPAFIHIFPYSKRPGTRAAEMPDQVQDSIKTDRVKKLEELSDRLNRQFIEENKGVREKVLWESVDKDGNMSGYTGNYIRVERPYQEGKIGEIEEMTL